MKKAIAIIVMAVMAIGLISTQALAKEVKVADFDTGTKPNLLGEDFGAWDYQPTDFEQTCTEAFDASVKHGDSGFSMRLDYDVDAPSPAFNGFWMKLGGLDATGYNKLVMWVKGSPENGHTNVFKVELKNDQGETGAYYVTCITGDWKKIEIPLDRFAGITNLSSLSEFVIVFEDRIVDQKEGTIYLDDISFSE